MFTRKVIYLLCPPPFAALYSKHDYCYELLLLNKVNKTFPNGNWRGRLSFFWETYPAKGPRVAKCSANAFAACIGPKGLANDLPCSNICRSPHRLPFNVYHIPQSRSYNLDPRFLIRTSRAKIHPKYKTPLHPPPRLSITTIYPTRNSPLPLPPNTNQQTWRSQTQLSPPYP